MMSDEFGTTERTNILCTFKYKRGCYFLEMAEDGTYSAGKFCFGIFEGIRKSQDDLSERVIAVCNMLIRCHNAEPQKYRFEGENYIIYDADSSGVRVRKDKNPLFFLRFIRPSAIIIKFTVAMIIAWVYAFAYVSMWGMKWLMTTFPGVGINGLRIMLYAVEMIGAALLFILRKDDRSVLDLFLNAFLPENIFTVAGLAKSYISARAAVITAIGIFLCFKLLPCIISAVREHERKEKIRHVSTAFKNAYMPAFVFMLICVMAARAIGLTGISAKSSADIKNLTDQTVLEQYETACENINQGVWYTLSEQEKIDTLQAICDYECKTELGCEPVRVISAYLDNDGRLGEYNHMTKVISVNQSLMSDADVYDIVDTLIHETRHVYQHAVAEAFDMIETSLDERSKELDIFRYAVSVRDNFFDYIDGDMDFDGYYDQDVERDSRLWAESRLESTYLRYILAEK